MSWSLNKRYFQLRNSKVRSSFQFFASFQNSSLSSTNNLGKPSQHQTNQGYVMISAVEFQNVPNIQTGNSLIDEYGHNDINLEGENGRSVRISRKDPQMMSSVLEKYRINIIASDIIPLNRMVPDSRPVGCMKKIYPDDLPRTSIVIPFYDEWPSVLLRTVYSIINRTPRHLIQEIILVDDNSQIEKLKAALDSYVKRNFPRGLVKVIHSPTREGLIKARLRGWRASTGEVIAFFDSHMEVNIDWLQPLLTAIKNDRKTIAMGMLDYINMNNFEYHFSEGYFVRYGFDWRLVFFEAYFRPDQSGPSIEDPRPGTVMVGPAFAVDSKYFGEIGAYDDGMKIWGGENLEFPWRTMDVGDLSERLAIKEKLKCKNFTWYIANVWPELNVFDQDALAWGSVRNIQTNKCLDNHNHLFNYPQLLFDEICTHKLAAQGFSWTKDHLLRSSLQCVVVKEMKDGEKPKLEDCVTGPRDEWEHVKGSYLKHVKSHLCLEHDGKELVMHKCNTTNERQHWLFSHYTI